MSIVENMYNLHFRIAFLEAKGEAFQTFFNKLMSLAYKNDFQPCAPWGNIGDQKNDGYLPSKRLLFQAYAPLEMTAEKAIKKIKEDFTGALVHWGKDFDEWCFVHNAWNGIPPHVQTEMNLLRESYSNIKLHNWSINELIDEFKLVKLEDKKAWFGEVIDINNHIPVEYKELEFVLKSISANRVQIDTLRWEIPAGKIEANRLDTETATFLNLGTSHAPKLEQFFKEYHDGFLDQRIAEQFKGKYLELRESFRYKPELLFAQLQKWASGEQQGTPKHQMAVLTVLAYYFGNCTIFEEPRVD